MKIFENFILDELDNQIKDLESRNFEIEGEIGKLEKKIKDREARILTITHYNNKLVFEPDVFYRRYPDIIEDIKNGMNKGQVFKKHKIGYETLDSIYRAMSGRRCRIDIKNYNMEISEYKEEIESNLKRIKELKFKRDNNSQMSIPGF